MIGFIIVIFAAMILLYDAASWGLVMYMFWDWFLLPVFPTLPTITFINAVGLMFLINLFKKTDTQILKKEYKDETAVGVAVIFAPWITLLSGWIVWSVIY